MAIGSSPQQLGRDTGVMEHWNVMESVDLSRNISR